MCHLSSLPLSPSLKLLSDTGANGTFIAAKDIGHDAIRITGPASTTVHGIGASTIVADHSAVVQIPGISDIRSTTYSDLTKSLVSSGDIVDQNLLMVYDSTNCYIYRPGSIAITADPLHIGTRDDRDGLWYFDIPASNASPHSATRTRDAHLAYQYSMTFQHIKDLVSFAHKTFGNPSLTTFNNAVRNNYFDFPHLTWDRVRLNQPHSVHTSVGHMRQKPKNSRVNFGLPATIADPCLAGNYIDLVEVRSCFDLTGAINPQFAVPYIFVMYNEAADYIHFIGQKDREGSTFLKSYKQCNDYFSVRGYKPTHERMDNEASRALMAYIKAKQIVLELTPANQHRGNHAERDIQSVKNHIIATFASADPTYPKNEWDRGLKQMEITFALLHKSKHNPAVSSYEFFKKSRWDFVKNPMAPFGTRVVALTAPATRPSFGNHGEVGWYTGPSKKHHKCFQVLIKSTLSTRIVETLTWHPHTFAVPKITVQDALVAALQDLAATIHEGDASRLLATDAFGTVSELIKMAKTVPLTEPYSPVDSINELAPPATQTVQRVPAPDISAWAGSPTLVATAPRLPTTSPEQLPAPALASSRTPTTAAPPTVAEPTAVAPPTPATLPTVPLPLPAHQPSPTRRSERTRVATTKYAAQAASNDAFFRQLSPDPARASSKGGLDWIHRRHLAQLAPAVIAIALLASTAVSKQTSSSVDPAYTYALPDQHGDLSYGATLSSGDPLHDGTMSAVHRQRVHLLHLFVGNRILSDPLAFACNLSPA